MTAEVIFVESVCLFCGAETEGAAFCSTAHGNRYRRQHGRVTPEREPVDVDKLLGDAQRWMPRALCASLVVWPHLDDDQQVEVCGDCPVRAECLDLADALEADVAPSTIDGHPVYGGENGHDRARRRRGGRGGHVKRGRPRVRR